MSQNKTVIQGLEPETNFGSSNATPNFYSRGAKPAARGTVVPGMQDSNGQEQSSPSQPAASTQAQPSRKIQGGKPIVGFLYSVSRTPLGEYWPLQMGKNSIGQSSECDIVLAEGTVSSNHAVIVTRTGRSGIIAAIKDVESTNGTFINGDPIDFAAEELHDGDIITIGTNYQFVFILIDAPKLGLAPVKEFIPIEVEDSQEDEDVPAFNFGGDTRPGGFDPFNSGTASWGGGSSNGTVGLDGSTSGNNHGGTIPM